jgi:predicted GH43/DUF377 family glycosyl hydrolase
MTKEKYASLAVVVYNKSIAILHKDETLLKTKLFFSVSDDGMSFSKRHDIELTLPNGKREAIGNCSGFRLATFGDTIYLTYVRVFRKKPTVVVAKSTDMVNFQVAGGSDQIKGPLAIVPLYKFRHYFLGYFGQDVIRAADSEDFDTWHITDPLLSPRKDRFDESKLHIIGNVTTDKGILVFYGSNGARKRDKIRVNVGAAIFSLTRPGQLIWRADSPLWEIEVDKRDYPLTSLGSVIFGDKIYLYWSSKRNEIFLSTIPMSFFTWENVAAIGPSSLKRSEENPIITPNPEHDWENVSTFNPAAIYLDDTVHLLYRAIGESGISVIGYASSSDGVHIDERLDQPIYATQPLDYKGKKVKRFSLQNISGGGWGGCEDPRLTRIDDKIYMTYVAFDGYNPPGVAVTSISVDDFRDKKWDWSEPVLLSKPGELTKNWVIFPEKINGKYAILHSTSPKILVDYVDSLDSRGKDINTYHNGNVNSKRWDNLMRGAGAPPIRTKYGWLVLYHAMDRRDPNRYKLGAMILDLKDPTKVLFRSKRPILEPVEMYENQGFKSGVVYACGAVVKDNELFVYYGGADSVVCVATADFDKFLDDLVTGKEKDDLVFHKIGSTAEVTN